MENYRRYLPPPVAIEQRMVENTGEPHLATLVLLDLSGSMGSVLDKLERALKEFRDELCRSYSVGRVDVCIIVFHDTVQVVVPFGAVYDMELPRLTAGGTTSMHAAIEQMLAEVEAREKAYEDAKTIAYRPLVMLMSDGYPTDSDNGTVQRLQEAERQHKLRLFPVAIGKEADTEFLRSLNIDGMLLRTEKEMVAGALQWLSKSVIKISQSSTKKGTRVTLPDPREDQLSIDVM